MNITEDIINELTQEGLVKAAIKIKSTPEIQIYTNHNINRYQWRDSRFTETCDVLENCDYQTRGELKSGIVKYLQERNDI